MDTTLLWIHFHVLGHAYWNSQNFSVSCTKTIFRNGDHMSGSQLNEIMALALMSMKMTCLKVKTQQYQVS